MVLNCIENLFLCWFHSRFKENELEIQLTRYSFKTNGKHLLKHNNSAVEPEQKQHFWESFLFS